MQRLCRLLSPLLAALALGCGSAIADGDASERLTVSAAASLTEALPAYGEALPGERRYAFAGSDELAAQIRHGARPDVFAAADVRHLARLAAEDLVEEPVLFARNELVIAVPRGSAIDSLDDLTAPGVDLVIGAEGVPAGDYARAALDGLPTARRAAILANVRSGEPDVKGVVGKVAQGAADAGLAYASDVAAADHALRAVRLPARLRPDVSYAIAVVKGTDHRAAARAFVAGLRDGAGRRALVTAGLRPVPR